MFKVATPKVGEKYSNEQSFTIDKLTEAPADASWCSSFITFNNDAVCFQYHYHVLHIHPLLNF